MIPFVYKNQTYIITDAHDLGLSMAIEVLDCVRKLIFDVKGKPVDEV